MRSNSTLQHNERGMGTCTEGGVLRRGWGQLIGLTSLRRDFLDLYIGEKQQLVNIHPGDGVFENFRGYVQSCTMRVAGPIICKLVDDHHSILAQHVITMLKVFEV